MANKDPLYAAPRDHAVLLDVPDALCIMIDGEGSPGGPAFRDALGALYPVAFTLHFDRKRAERGYAGHMGPLEGLWWSKGGEAFAPGPADEWRWTLLIRLPQGTTRAMVAAAKREARAKHPENAAIARVRVAIEREGRSAQIMHVGPYATEPATVERLESDVRALGLKPTGKHHEVYLGDPRRAKPQKLKTLLRRSVG